MPEQGRFYVLLSSDDTDFEPGKFYFDVELINEENGMVFRLFTFEFTLDGGPTNRRVNKGMGQWPTGDTITVVALSEGNPIVVVAPTLNLDGDVFGQLATIMETVDAMASHMEECDEKVSDLATALDETKANLDTLRQEFDVDHIALEELKEDVVSISNDIVDIQGELRDLRETLESQGSLISEHTEDLADLHQ